MPGTTHLRGRLRLSLLTLSLGLAPAPAAFGQAAQPIPDALGDNPPVYLGAPAEARPVAATPPPRHPHMAPNDDSNLHDDAYQTDTARRTGPLGRDMQRTSAYFVRECASVTFDRRGRIITVCVGLERPQLKLLDPRTLDTIASLDLPARDPMGAANIFTSFAGGGYFYLDDQDRAVIPTNDRHLLTVALRDDRFVVVRDVDLNGVVRAPDGIISALPDWSGDLWFVSGTGVVGRVGADGRIASIDTREPIGNSFAVDETGGVYIVTDAALYRFETGPGRSIRTAWRSVYANVGVKKPGQTQAGSGTTPTLMGKDLVAITDNADPMNVVVADRRTGRGVCAVPVFARGASATDNSLIATDDAIVVENNFGYSGPAATENGGTTEPGLERVDVDRAAGTCRKLWRSEERGSSVVPKLSLGNGLVYTYTKDPQPNNDDAWYLTALDFRSGRTIFKRLSGTGLGYNNNYAPITIGADGTVYVGTLGGLVALRDRVAPRQEVVPVPRRAAPIALRRCTSRRRFTIRLREPRRGRLVSARVTLGGRRLRVTRRAGRLTARVDLRSRPAGRVRVRIVARTSTGRRLRSTRTYRLCARAR